MVKFRNIRVKMKGGKTRIQRAMVLASGKLRFVKNKAHSQSRRTSSSPRHTKRRNVSLTKKRKGGHRSGSLIQSAERIGQVAALVAPYAEIALNKSERPAINWGIARLTGYSMDQHEWQWNRFVEGWGPVTIFSLAMVGRRKLNGLLRRI